MKRKRKRRSRRWIVVAMLVVPALAVGQGGLDRIGALFAGSGTASTANGARDENPRQAVLPQRVGSYPVRRPARDSHRARSTISGQPATTTASIVRPVRAVGDIDRWKPDGMRRARRPQSGDCACPYDLMIDGSMCGTRSTFLTPGREKPICYR